MADPETLSFEVTVPKPRFHRDDFVRYQQSSHVPAGTPMDIIIRIKDIIYHGTWALVKRPPSADGFAMSCSRGEYTGVIQEGSVAMNGKPLQPGRWMLPAISDLDRYGEITDYTGPVCSGDTVDNSQGRAEAWCQQHAEVG